MQYDFAVQPNQSQQIDVKGRFFKYKSGVGLIRVRLSTGGYLDVLPGQGVWNVDFTSLIVTDLTGLANGGVIVAGEFDYRDDRIAGTVDVVDGGKTRTNTSSSCIGYGYSSATAGQYSMVQLVNPATSGKHVYLEQIGFVSAGAATAGMLLRRYDAALAGLYAKGAKKRLGDPDSLAEIRVASNAALLGTVLTTIDRNQRTFKLTEPLQIVPGVGVVLINGDLNEDIGASFEYFEESI